MRTIDPIHAARLLVDSGLLFDLNRQVLHPHGLALAVTTDDHNNLNGNFIIQDYRDEPDKDVWFAKDHPGKVKIIKFNKENTSRLNKRKKKLGYIIQPLESI